jgi:hypothetical protein
MKRSEVKTFIEAGVTALGQSVGFGTGRLSEFNKERSNEYPTAWLETLEVNPDITESGLVMDTWQINLHILKKDDISSSTDQYEEIIDQCDEIAQKLIYKYNHIISGYATATIDGYSRTPFIKDHADVLTGVLLQFTLTAPDTTDHCE